MANTMRAIGDVVMTVCFFALCAWICYLSSKNKGDDE